MPEEQLPLFAPPPPVTLEISFEDLLGQRAEGMTEGDRRKRWATWLRLSRRADGGEGARWWQCHEGCDGCVHMRGFWCGLMGLPCSVNPRLTFGTGMIGMACMGAGYQSKDRKERHRNDPF